MTDEPGPIFHRIITLLDGAKVPYRHLHHEPTPTSADSARVRGESIEIGGKALLLKVGDEFMLLVMSAARRLDSGALRRHFGTNRTRFATTEELHELTGLVPGSVPPFGEPILPFPLHVDRSILEQPRIAFNAGARTESIIMSMEDYRRLAVIESELEVTRGS